VPLGMLGMLNHAEAYLHVK